jgi:predicted O-methyltransferase YrrM
MDPTQVVQLRILPPHFAGFLMRHPLGAWRYARRSDVAISSLSGLFETSPEELKRLKTDFYRSAGYTSIMRSMSDLLRSIDPLGSLILYLACRVSKPKIVVETGVASGVSSTAILQAMQDNNLGMLHSVSLPEEALSSVDKDAVANRVLGWIIPKQLTGRWILHRGSSKDVLPSLLRELDPIDIFFHDSDHSYENVTFELAEAAPRLRKGGAMIVDDVNFPYVRSAFENGCNATGAKPWYILRLFPPPEEIGIARKND